MSPNDSMSMVQALFMAVLQGVTELFPISSLGHAVVVPHLIGWNIDTTSTSYLPFLVALHLGTATALLLYFWRDWWELLSSLVSREPGPVPGQSRRLLFLLVIGTIPAGLLGLLLEKRLAGLFGHYQMVALFLTLNGFLLFVGEVLQRRRRIQEVSPTGPAEVVAVGRFQELAQLSARQAVAIGLSQTLALLPGFSRSGATMVGGLIVGLTHQSAARFSFLLSTPIILAAAVLELPKLLRPEMRPELALAFTGGLVAGVFAYASTAFLMRYFRSFESNALVPFGVYCIALGALALIVG